MVSRSTDESGETYQAGQILIVEDDTLVREFCRRLLRTHYQVDTAENGRVALDMLAQRSYEVMLIDLHMPEMDGLTLLQHLHERYPDIDAIVFTAFETVDTVRQALRLGAFDYLSKPVNANDLERTIHKCFQLRRVRQEKERLSELVVMYQFSQAIATSLDTDTQMLQIADFLWMRFIPATLAISMIYPEERQLRLLFAQTTAGCRNVAALGGLIGNYDDELELQVAHMHLTNIDSACDPARFAGLVLRTHDRNIGYLHITRGDDQPPFDISERQLLTVFASQIAASLDNARLHQQLQVQHWQTISALAKAIDARDRYTYGHSERVMRYAVRLAEESGLPAERVELLRYAGLLHDVGKIGIRDYILLKPGELSDEEYAVMQQHPAIGVQIVGQVRGLEETLPIIAQHHERIDGRGYPHGLKGHELRIEARILAIADAFEAMTAERAYRNAMDCDQALDVLLQGRGTKWDAELVDTFVALFRREGEQLQRGPALKQELIPLIQPEEMEWSLVANTDARD